MITSQLSERYSSLVDTKTRNSLVLKDGVIFNNRYEGSATAGAVKVRKSGAATVANYDKTNGATLTEGASQWITVTVDKDKAINEIVDGFDAASIPDGVIADRLDESGYAMARQVDVDGAAELAAAGTALSSTTALTKNSIYEAAVDAYTALTKAGVPAEGRYMLVTPDVYALMLKSPEFVRASDLGDDVVQTGAIGSMGGMAVYVTNSFGTVTKGEGQSATEYDVEFVAGHPNYATRVNEWAVPIGVEDIKDGKHIGASAIQGRKVYAHKVTNPDCILVKTKAHS